ncbi:MAG: arylesterase, partial [Chthoniobacterales bacterium]
MRTLVSFLCFSLAVSATLAEKPTEDPVRDAVKTPNVLVLGDSLSAGYGVKRAEAYPALLSEKAARSDQPLHIINAGISGDTSAGGLHRLPSLLEHRVDVLILELGINDIFRGVPVVQIATNLQKIIDLTRARYPQARIVIVGMQLPQTTVNDDLTSFGEMYGKLAGHNSAELLPFLLAGVAGNPELNQRDMIHPNAAGQK